MIENGSDQHFNNETKKKRILVVLFCLIFLVPFCFGVVKLLPGCSAPTVSYEVELANDYGGGLTLSKNQAYPENNFSADISINRSIIRDKVMPDALGTSDVLCNDQAITYTYSVSVDKFSARINIPKDNIKGNISINVPLATPTEKFPITLKANGGKFDDASTQKTFNVTLGETLNDLLGYKSPSDFREGYHFTHWELESDRTQKLKENEVIPYTPGGATYLANCDLNTYHVSFKGNGGKFNGSDTLELDYCYDDVINLNDGYMDPTWEGHTFLYYEATDVSNENQRFYPTDRITIDKTHEARFGLRAIYANNLEITFDASPGQFSDGNPTKIITAYDGITINEIEEKEGVDLTPIYDVQGYSFIYYKNGSDTIYWNTPLYGSAGTLKLDSVFAECSHSNSYINFAVDNNHVYGICPNCGKPIPLTDNELSIAAAKKAILVPDESDPTFFRESNQQEARQLIHDTPAGETLHLYLIGDNFELYGSRDGGIIDVHLHGVLNNENQKISSFRCYGVNADGTKTYVGYGGMHLTVENLIMDGSLEYGTWYLGIQSDYLTCINCDFKGVQSFYSPGEVICENCTFDSTMLEHYDEEEGKMKSEYSIYSYAPYNIEFIQCHFVSRGKALKLYTEGYVKNAVYKLTDCTFAVVDKLEDKAAIQVDSTYVENYNIYITRCTQEGHTAGLYQDTGTNAHFIVD